jgi:hypothetical protein
MWHPNGMVSFHYDSLALKSLLSNMDYKTPSARLSRLPAGIGALNTSHYFDPEGFRRFQLELDLEIYKHYVPGEGGEEVYKQVRHQIGPLGWKQ